jgi:hypothetical protein
MSQISSGLLKRLAQAYHLVVPAFTAAREQLQCRSCYFLIWPKHVFLLQWLPHEPPQILVERTNTIYFAHNFQDRQDFPGITNLESSQHRWCGLKPRGWNSQKAHTSHLTVGAVSGTLSGSTDQITCMWLFCVPGFFHSMVTGLQEQASKQWPSQWKSLLWSSHVVPQLPPYIIKTATKEVLRRREIDSTFSREWQRSGRTQGTR